jgi:hypothetical protein
MTELGDMAIITHSHDAGQSTEQVPFNDLTAAIAHKQAMDDMSSDAGGGEISGMDASWASVDWGE